jgi:hypothetical protein
MSIILDPKAFEQEALFKRMANCCTGVAMHDIAGAALNLLLVVIEKTNLAEGDALRRYDATVGYGKEILKQRFEKKRREKIQLENLATYQDFEEVD